MKLPQISAKDLAKALQKMGFEFKRQKGSHMFFSHKDGRTTVVPNHAGEKLDRGLLNKILKHDLKVSREFLLSKL